MASEYHETFQRVLDGSDRSARGQFLRVATALAEPFYASVMLWRNLGYARGMLKTESLGRATVSVGNITTGGTGKTPVVSWLAGRLREAGHQPAILMRGYKSNSAGLSDEQQMLDRALNGGGAANIPVRANPDRVASAGELLRERPGVDVFILDDGFQHRKVKRDFNLVLVSAVDPWGLGHVLPRGLLREPLGGLRRADAFLITRCSLAGAAANRDIHERLKKYKPEAPIYCADHTHSAIQSGRTGETEPIESVAGQRFYAICGIANPASFDMQMRSLGGEYVGHQWFPDHHDYTAADLAMVRQKAREAGAERILTTEKDWVKIGRLPGAEEMDPPIGVVELTIRFLGEDEGKLVERVLGVVGKGGGEG